jgi:four helix bundle protein
MLFEKLTIWQKSHEFTKQVYKITSKFPKSELYGITSQLRRASSSVPANIVEGHSRKGTKEFINFLSQARGSLSESQYFLILSKDLGYISSENFSDLINLSEEISKMLNSFINTLRSKL